MTEDFHPPVLRTPPGRGGMGGGRASGYPRKQLKAKHGTKLNRFSKRRKKNGPVWDELRKYLLANLERRHGRPSATNAGIECPCSVCQGWFPSRLLEPDHLEGRNSKEPGTLNPYWDPTLIDWKCSTCHEGKTNCKTGADHKDYGAETHSDYRRDTLALKYKIMERLGPIEGSMKYTDSDQAEAILWSIGLDTDTCERCGESKCDGGCTDDGERPVE